MVANAGLDIEGIAAVVAVVKTLADPTRLLILSVLSSRECSVGELAELAEVSIAAASQHLARLRTMGLVSRRQAGNRIFYRATSPHLTAVLADLNALTRSLPAQPENARPITQAEQQLLV